MSELSALYQDLILDHCRDPRHFGELTSPTHTAEGINMLCGDELKVYLQVNKDIIENLQYTAKGCAISIASASLMAEQLTGHSVKDCMTQFERFQNMLVNGEMDNTLGKLQVFENVRKYPMRIKCATLAWHALKAALLQKNASVTTEEP